MLGFDLMVPYYTNQFEVSLIKDTQDIFYEYKTLTENIVRYKWEDRILWLDINIHLGNFIDTYQSLRDTNKIKICHFDKEGNITLLLSGDVSFISTPSLSGDYTISDPLILKASYVFKNLTIEEDGKYGNIGDPEKIKLF